MQVDALTRHNVIDLPNTTPEQHFSKDIKIKLHNHDTSEVSESGWQLGACLNATTAAAEPLLRETMLELETVRKQEKVLQCQVIIHIMWYRPKSSNKSCILTLSNKASCTL